MNTRSLKWISQVHLTHSTQANRVVSLLLVRLISSTIVTEKSNCRIVTFFCSNRLRLILHSLKKALILSAFFVFVLFYSVVFARNNCGTYASPSLEKAAVKWVYDGDTLLLKDERKIRIIGIDSPETRHHKQKAETYGARAREALRELLNKYNYQVLLEYDQQHQDKYSRTLAHVFLPNGTNISSWQLDQGLAKTLIIPPNVKYVECYKQAKKTAQKESRNIWSLKNYQLRSAATLDNKIKGFVRLEGKIKSVKKRKKQIVMKFESNSTHPIQIKIRKHDLRYFESIDLNNLKGKRIIVSGKLKNKHGNRVIQISHSSQLEVLPIRLSAEINAPTIKWSSRK